MKWGTKNNKKKHWLSIYNSLPRRHTITVTLVSKCKHIEADTQAKNFKRCFTTILSQDLGLPYKTYWRQTSVFTGVVLSVISALTVHDTLRYIDIFYKILKKLLIIVFFLFDIGSSSKEQTFDLIINPESCRPEVKNFLNFPWSSVSDGPPY